MRFGDVLQAGIVYLGTALGFVLSWFAAALAREYKKRSARPAAKEVSWERKTSLSHSV